MVDQECGCAEYACDWAQLCSALLQHGGRAVVPPSVPDLHVADLLVRLEVSAGADAAVVDGASSQCHQNSAEMWLADEVATIWTGYALSDDGLWRQHTWARRAGGQLVETTVRRALYAGFALSDEEAVVFAAGNTDPDLFTRHVLEGGRITRAVYEMTTGRPAS